MTNATRMAQRFTNEKVLTGYIQHKTGKGHSDFSDPTPIYVEPSNSIRWQKKVIVLTNRHSYSATNDFVNSMRCFPNVTLVGDKTGGGSGLHEQTRADVLLAPALGETDIQRSGD